MDSNSVALMEKLMKRIDNHLYFGAKYSINYEILTRVHIKIIM